MDALIPRPIVYPAPTTVVSEAEEGLREQPKSAKVITLVTERHPIWWPRDDDGTTLDGGMTSRRSVVAAAVRRETGAAR